MSGYVSKDLIWWRPFRGRGIAIERTPLRFSERIGRTKYLKLPFGWRATYLEKYK